MMKLVKIISIAATATSCAHTKRTSAPPPVVCPAVYQPYLCLVTVKGEHYAAYGTNRCEALKKLATTLELAGRNADLLEVECGEVHGLDKGTTK